MRCGAVGVGGKRGARQGKEGSFGSKLFFWLGLRLLLLLRAGLFALGDLGDGALARHTGMGRPERQFDRDCRRAHTKSPWSESGGRWLWSLELFLLSPLYVFAPLRTCSYASVEPCGAKC